MDDLIAALHAQTAAMQELADSNRAMVDLLAAQFADDIESGEPSRGAYMDGTLITSGV